MNAKLPFGKYKGETVHAVAKKDLDYLHYLLDQECQFKEEDLRKAVEEVTGRPALKFVPGTPKKGKKDKPFSVSANAELKDLLLEILELVKELIKRGQ